MERLYRLLKATTKVSHVSVATNNTPVLPTTQSNHPIGLLGWLKTLGL